MNIVCSCVYNCPPGAKGVMRDFRALWALEESGQPYHREWIDLAAGELRGDRFLALNPLERVRS